MDSMAEKKLETKKKKCIKKLRKLFGFRFINTVIICYTAFILFIFSFLWLVLLWVLVLAMILRFWRIDKRAAWINIPYLVWLTFAGYLNLGIWWLN